MHPDRPRPLDLQMGAIITEAEQLVMAIAIDVGENDLSGRAQGTEGAGLDSRPPGGQRILIDAIPSITGSKDHRHGCIL